MTLDRRAAGAKRPEAATGGAAETLTATSSFHATLVDALTRAALEVLHTVHEDWRVAIPSPGTPTEEALVRAVLSFSGGISGHLMVSTSAAQAMQLYRLIARHDGCADHAMLVDVVGELCNQILGRINSFFVMRGVSVHHGTPTVVLPRELPNGEIIEFALVLGEGAANSVYLEYGLDEFDESRLLAPVEQRVLTLGDVRYM